MTLSSLVNVHCLSSKKEWISKWKRNKLICTENRMIKLSTAILLLVEVESLVCSREFNFSEIIFVLLVRYFELYLSALLEFCRICTRLKKKKGTKYMFQEPRQRTPMETFQFKGGRSTTRKWWNSWQTRCLVRVIFYLHFKLKRP